MTFDEWITETYGPNHGLSGAELSIAREAWDAAHEQCALISAPSIEAARAMGEKGGAVVEDERIAFEAWMRGHNWTLCAKWNGITYIGDTETHSRLCQDAIRTRQLWAAWRDRAALARNG